MTSHTVGRILVPFFAITFVAGIDGEASAQPPGPASNFVEAVMDEYGDYAYFRMRGTRSTPRGA